MDKEEPMDTSETQFHWYFMADCLRWHRFEEFPLNPISSECLEHHYFRRLSQIKLDFYTSIDFSAMKHTDLSTGKERRIKRSPVTIDKSCPCFTAAPVFWEKHDPMSSYQLIPLFQQSDEYQRVEKYTINDGLLNNSILSIKRIQNVDLWEFYCRKNIQLMKIHGIQHTEERHLFHGTSTKNIDSICKFNFDLRLAGKNGIAHGKGIYFAKHASYADRYSTEGVLPGSSWGFPTKIMFLARVIVGTSTKGHDNLLKPDVGNVHQSSVDNTAHPQIFVIFDPNQIYPDYLIEEISTMDKEEPKDTTGFYWYFLADCLRWHRFEDYFLNPLSSEYLEHHYFRKPRHINTGFFTSIDFSAMTHTDIRTGQEREIKRSPIIIDKSCSCFIAAPVVWEKHDPTSSFQLIPLVQQSHEYQRVENYMITEGLFSNMILSIKRIQNVDLWEFYCRKKIQLKKIHGIKHIEERCIFHGTSPENIDSICKFNFDLRLAGKNGSVYGKGIYFAKYAFDADHYSTAGVLPGSAWSFPTKVMFLARVIVGTSTKGHQHLLKPDDGNVHQSSVDDTANPKIFVIFDPNQIYPEYLIEYI